MVKFLLMIHPGHVPLASRATTRDIRRSILGDKTLSTYAHN